MDHLLNEVLGMILDELKPSSLFIWDDLFNPDGRRTIRDINLCDFAAESSLK